MTAPVTAARLDRLGRDVEALLEEHADGARPRDPALAAYADDPAAFVETVTGGWLWEKPRAIIAALRDHRKVAVRACHGASKDWTAARIALWWVFALGGRVICSAPSMHQLVDILFDTEFRGAFNGATPKLAGKLWTTKLKIDGEPHAGIIGMVSVRDAKLTGLHAPKTLVLITECNGVEGWAIDALESNALDPSYRRTSMLPNCGYGRSRFWRCVVALFSVSPGIRPANGLVTFAVSELITVLSRTVLVERYCRGTPLMLTSVLRS